MDGLTDTVSPLVCLFNAIRAWSTTMKISFKQQEFHYSFLSTSRISVEVCVILARNVSRLWDAWFLASVRKSSGIQNGDHFLAFQNTFSF
jgi:hypothetical protein